MSDTLYSATNLKPEGIPGGRIDSFHIKGQSGRIFVGTLTFSSVSGETHSSSWRASYTGPSTGYTIHERESFREKLHAVPSVNAALKRFISEQINAFRESPKPTAAVMLENTVRDAVSVPGDKSMPEGAAKTNASQPSEKTDEHQNNQSPSLEDTAQVFRTLPDRLRIIASLLAEDAGAQQIADAIGTTKLTLKGYFCQLRHKFSLGVPGLRELFRALFKFDMSLRMSVSSPKIAETAVASITVNIPAELFGKEVLSTFSQRERAVAFLLAKGESLSQISSKMNLRLSDVGICKSRLRKFLGCSDDASLHSRLQDIAEVKIVHSATQGLGSIGTDAAESTEEAENELLMFPDIMQAVEEFRSKLTSGYELSLGDCVVVPGGNVVSVSIRVKQVR